jgi:hypothetical protein
MKIGAPSFRRRFILLAAAGTLAVVLTACTGVGGGYLPPGPSVGSDQFPEVLFPEAVFTGQASFGFTFSCEDKGGINPPTGQLRIQLAYTDKGTGLLAAPFSIHGIVDKIDPGLESYVCSGLNTPPQPLPPNALIFLGRYRPTTSPPPGPLSTCPARETKTTPLCRFEVAVQDNDRNFAPSTGDFFSIKLSSATVLDCTNPLECSQLPPAKVFYARGGFLEGGNLTVK